VSSLALRDDVQPTRVLTSSSFSQDAVNAAYPKNVVSNADVVAMLEADPEFQALARVCFYSNLLLFSFLSWISFSQFACIFCPSLLSCFRLLLFVSSDSCEISDCPSAVRFPDEHDIMEDCLLVLYLAFVCILHVFV
jgi:hypothetical protein